MSHEYDLAPVDDSPAGRAQVATLLTAAFGARVRHITVDYLEWLYHHNPLGPAIGWNALARDGLAAHYVVVPIQARLGGCIAHGALSLHTATHPDHQRQGLFVELATRTYETARAKGLEFVVGVGNRNSTHGLVTSLGFQDAGALDVAVCVGPLRRRTGGSETPTWERVWDEPTLRWRLARPGCRYVIARGDDGEDEILGDSGRYHVPVVLGRFSSQEAQATRLPVRRGLGPRLLPRLWIGADAGLVRPGWRFISVPPRLRPAPLNLTFKDLTGAARTLAPGRVRFQAIDFDVF